MQKIDQEQILHGGDYNPEQWLHSPKILEQDIVLMKEAHINVVTLGVFSWSTLEPKENDYQLEWLEDIINNLYKNGIKTILATPSAARPKWLSDKYPEVLRVRGDRTRNLFGGRHNHCYTSPIYREKIQAINERLAKQFAEHPAIIMWHISNELSGDCHCPLCQQAFQNWLKQKYKTIETLNRKWYTTFWSHTYQSFEQIESPSPVGETMLHALNLDWKRFVTAQTIDFMKHEIAGLRNNGAKQPTTTNLMYHYKGLNYGDLVKHIDIVSWDSYPLWHKGADSQIAWDTAMQHDYMRSLKQRSFLLMESCPSSTNWQGVSKLKRPGLLEAASLQAIAHGSDSVQYFQIRQSQGSSEKFHGAVIEHYGKNSTRVFKEITQLGANLSELSELVGSKTNAAAAILYDRESQWAMEDAQGPRNKGLHYLEAVMKSYRAFKKYGVDVDIIDMEQELNRYKVIVVPMLYMFRSGIEEKIQKFVKNGGVLFLTYWSGIVDENDLCFLGGTPHKLIDVMGVRCEEIDGLYDGETNIAVPMAGNKLKLSDFYSCNNLCSLVSVETATPLMVYQDDFYAGQSVFTHNSYGAGAAYYIGADMEQAFYDEVYAKILKTASCDKLLSDIPEEILVSSRENENYHYTFVQNYGQTERVISIPKDSQVILGNVNGNIKTYETMIIKTKR